MNDGKINGVAERFVDNPWVKAVERIAVLLIVGALVWVGNTLNSLQITVAEVRTTQKEAIVPGVQNLNNQVNTISGKMLSHKWFSRDDAERLDDAHRSLMHKQDERLRDLEKRRSP